jgi:alkaline phosphatase D
MNPSSHRFFVAAILFPIVISSCNSGKESEGPFFGNGFHNGWADQSTIVIWTRLTQIPEGNSGGAEFIDISSEEAKRLDKEGDAEEIHAAQIPEGLTLDDMYGACPGAPGKVKLTYYASENANKKTSTAWVAVDIDKNFTSQWKLKNLTPDTKYIVRIKARPEKGLRVSNLIEGTFRTPPAEDSIRDIEFCVVTCHDHLRRDTAMGHKIYKAMMELCPDFYVHTGDIEYYDKPLPYAMTEELMYFKWDRLFALPLQREFWSEVTTYFMKDDHDALRNDCWPGKKYGTVSWERGLEIFDKEQFPSHDTFYKTIRWGKDLQIWITEGRNYRSHNDMPDGKGKSIYGPVQKAWLYKTLQESDATFKVIINANPILGPDRKNKRDNYANEGFQTEGDEIRAFLDQFDNVYLCNGDRHWQYVTHFEGSNLWEFSCGAGADIHAGGWPQDDKRPEHRFLRVKGGFLRGYVSRVDGVPTLTFEHMDVDGNVVHQEVFRK